MSTTTERATYTPGPWGLAESGRHVYYLNPQIEAGDEDVDDPRHDSIVAKCDGFGAFSGIPDGEIEANARLISAAPELAEALRDLLAVAEWDHQPEWRPQYEAARAALAKAGISQET